MTKGCYSSHLISSHMSITLMKTPESNGRLQPGTNIPRSPKGKPPKGNNPKQCAQRQHIPPSQIKLTELPSCTHSHRCPSAIRGITEARSGKQANKARAWCPWASKDTKALQGALSDMVSNSEHSYKMWCHQPPVILA